jgi:hypothetical protein
MLPGAALLLHIVRVALMGFMASQRVPAVVPASGARLGGAAREPGIPGQVKRLERKEEESSLYTGMRRVQLRQRWWSEKMYVQKVLMQCDGQSKKTVQTSAHLSPHRTQLMPVP